MDPKRALILILLLAAAGCAGRETAMLVARPDGLPPVASVSGVPFFPQGDRACGPASLAMVLGWSGLPANPDSLSAQVYTPGREGSLATDMIAAARRNGRLAVPLRGGLPAVLGEIAAGHPVVVFQNLGLEVAPVWHFAVATGYDLPNRALVLNSGLEQGAHLSLDTFEHTWQRAGGWAVVVLPPDRLPANAGEREVMGAAMGLERVGRAHEAAQAYGTMLQRWPDSLGAAMGLGNALHAQGDVPGAVGAFSRAATRHPQAGAAWNNLAHALLEDGRKAEAVAAAERAVRLDEAFADTLAEAKRQ